MISVPEKLKSSRFHENSLFCFWVPDSSGYLNKDKIANEERNFFKKKLNGKLS